MSFKNQKQFKRKEYYLSVHTRVVYRNPAHTPTLLLDITDTWKVTFGLGLGPRVSVVVVSTKALTGILHSQNN